MYYNESQGKSRWSVWGVKFKLFECITMNHRVSLDEVSEVSKFKLFECITMNHRVSLDEVSEVSKFKLFECITMNHRASLDEVSEVSSLNCLNVLQWITG